MDNGHYVNNVCAECNVHQQWKPNMKHAMWSKRFDIFHIKDKINKFIGLGSKLSG